MFILFTKAVCTSIFMRNNKMGKDLMMKMSKAIATKAKIDKWDLIKELLQSKRSYYQSEQTTCRMGKNFYNPSDIALISSYKEHKQNYKEKKSH